MSQNKAARKDYVVRNKQKSKSGLRSNCVKAKKLTYLHVMVLNFSNEPQMLIGKGGDQKPVGLPSNAVDVPKSTLVGGTG